jgi:hypothetical protein
MSERPSRPPRYPVVVELLGVGGLFVALALLGIVFVRLLAQEAAETRQIVRELRDRFDGVADTNIKLHRAMLCVLTIEPQPNERALDRAIRKCRARYLRPVLDLEEPADPPASGSSSAPGTSRTTPATAPTEEPPPDQEDPPDDPDPPASPSSPAPDPPDDPPPAPPASPSPTIGCLPIIGCI